MSNATVEPATLQRDGNHPPAGGNGHAVHDPHLAHHFDTPEQQFSSAKLGMWVFLGTEILMFGGLFCGYAVYRHNHPTVFEYAHHFLDKWLGAVNTLVLITSSLTMAWAVRSSQLGDQKNLRWLLAVTILGGFVFLGIKSVEYRAKWEHVLFIGEHNQFRSGYVGPHHLEEEEAHERSLPGHTNASPPPGAMPIEANSIPPEKSSGPAPAKTPSPEPSVPQEGPTPSATSDSGAQVALRDSVSLLPGDPNADTPDQAKIRPNFKDPAGLAPRVVAEKKESLQLSDMSQTEKERLYTFFGVYFFMTGLHGLHVVIGMSLILWVLLRSMGPRQRAWTVPLIPGSIGLFLAVVGIIVNVNTLIILGLAIAVVSVGWAMLRAASRRNASGEGEFGPTYYTPVDLVGLYWHLVDLIWIFLFPLLYLIH